MRSLALYAIRVYQRHLSPRKGFRCAYHVHTGHSSCSHLGYRAVRRYGVVGGMIVTRARLRRCSATHRSRTPLPRAKLAQMGFIDGCDGCDISPDGCSMVEGCSDVAACSATDDCSDCSWPWSSGEQRRRKKREIDHDVANGDSSG